MKHDTKHTLFQSQTSALRNPAQIVGSASFENAGITSKTLQYQVYGHFADILKEKKLTLLVTREYEHLVLALNADKGKLKQTFINLPHPSGIAVSPDEKSVFIASTRNPNQIFEFKTASDSLERIENKENQDSKNKLFPVRTKFFPGAYYLHDLVFIGNELFANSVGQNGVIKVDFNNQLPDSICWYPKCIEDPLGKPDFNANYLQLNSIAAGDSLESSYFSASADKISNRRPGHKNFPVNKRGVIFSGKTREPIAYGLTRPHSARLIDGTIWVDNSGYGEVGFIENEKFVPFAKLPGWTRGLYVSGDILFVGVSRVLDRFRQYAPGIKEIKQICGIFALDINSGKELGSIIFPYGNQIFGIEGISFEKCEGFIYQSVNNEIKKSTQQYFNYKF